MNVFYNIVKIYFALLVSVAAFFITLVTTYNYTYGAGILPLITGKAQELSYSVQPILERVPTDNGTYLFAFYPDGYFAYFIETDGDARRILIEGTRELFKYRSLSEYNHSP